MFLFTTATEKIDLMTARIRAVQGGTSASKTISILMKLINDAQSDETPCLTSIVSESFPHLRRGAMRDFKNIMTQQGYWKQDLWSKTESTYTFETGSQIEFFSSDDGDKLRGARRKRLFINEANNVSFEAFEQLEMRTEDYIYLDWNPTNEFWFYTEVLHQRTDVQHIVLTYLDNEGCPDEIRKSIEQRRNRVGWWKVYALGQLGEVEGKIYKGWQIVKEIPHEARLVRRALDYGYTNDPTALYDIYRYNGGFIVHQQLYRKGMSNRQIAEFIINLPNGDTVPVVADSSEPKSNDELVSYGLVVLPAVKGQGSVMSGIQYVQDQRMSITESSVEGIKEYRNYMFMIDKNGKILNVPEGGMDHAMDAIRYGVSSLLVPDELTNTATVTWSDE